MTVTRDELEERIAFVRERVADPSRGVYGAAPDGQESIGWQINRENALFLGGGAAALLQLAHPYVAHAVDQHSETRRDPIGRFQRTFFHVYRIAFGDLEHAIQSARRVHEIHRRVTGTLGESVGPFREGHRYEALDEDALAWVHATLVHTAVQVFERVVRPLSPEEKDGYYGASRLFALLFGVPWDALPDDFAGFARYCDDKFESALLTVGRPAQEIAWFLLHPPGLAQRGVFRWYRIMTADLLPVRIRHQYGFAVGPSERWVVDRSERAMRQLLPTLPDRVRFVPAYHEAKRREVGEGGPDKFGRLLSRVALKALMPKRRAA